MLPSNFHESYEHFVDISDNAGYAFTFVILTENTHHLLQHSAVCIATADPASNNLRPEDLINNDFSKVVWSNIDDIIEMSEK